MNKKGVMTSPRYVTQNLPGTGGHFRVEPEDFLVEEIPLSEPKGEGEHLYLWVEKRKMSTLEAVRLIGRSLGVSESAVGYAGMKDSKAVTRQWISVQFPRRNEGTTLPRLEKDLPSNVQILRFIRGRSKLRRGVLRGNRFEIRIRDAGPKAVQQAATILEILQKRGLPNAFGQQRFGARGHSAALGLALVLRDWDRFIDCLLGGNSHSGYFYSPGKEEGVWIREAKDRYLKGDFAGAFKCYPPGWVAERRVLSRLAEGASPEKAVRAVPRRERMLFGSAFQAAVFNTCLTKRIKNDDYDRLIPGDVAVRYESGKSWRIADPKKEAGPWTRFEVSPAGPILGERMLDALGNPGKIETETLREFNVTKEAATNGLVELGLRGERRPYRVPIQDLDVDGAGKCLLLRFALPPGAYATEVLREVMKSDPPVGASPHFEVTSRAVSSLENSSEEGEIEE